jgi:uncharacterized membrane protein YqjE
VVDATDIPLSREPTGTLKGLGASLLGLVGTRFELIGVEAREEGLRVQRLLVLGAIAALLIGASLVLLGIFIVAMFWDSNPLLALGIVTVLYGAAGGALLMNIRSALAKGPMPFAATVREFREDVSALRDRHE